MRGVSLAAACWLGLAGAAWAQSPDIGGPARIVPLGAGDRPGELIFGRSIHRRQVLAGRWTPQADEPSIGPQWMEPRWTEPVILDPAAWLLRRRDAAAQGRD